MTLLRAVAFGATLGVAVMLVVVNLLGLPVWAGLVGSFIAGCGVTPRPTSEEDDHA